MNIWFFVLTVIFIVAAVAMILIILVQRPQGGGLAGAFGGAGGGTDTVFGGRVGDALTTMTIVAFIIYLGLAIGLNRVDSEPTASAATPPTDVDAQAAPTDAVPTPLDNAELPPEIPPEILEQIRRDAEQKQREAQGQTPPAGGGGDGSTPE